MAEQKTALITGCSPGGIGHALAIELHQRGMRVIATGRTLEKLADLAGKGISCVTLSLDDESSIADCHSQVSKLLAGRGLDYLFNNAGQATFRPATETSIPQAKALFNANFFGLISLTQTLLPHLLVAKGTIVNSGSVASHMPLPYMSIYCASKAALYAYTECLRVEVAPLGVDVTYLHVGHIKTNTNHVSGHYHLGTESLWYPAREAFERDQKSAGGEGMDVAVFARDLAEKVLGKRRDRMWIGESAWGCWAAIALERWLPFGWRILPAALTKMSELGKVGVHKG